MQCKATWLCPTTSALETHGATEREVHLPPLAATQASHVPWSMRVRCRDWVRGTSLSLEEAERTPTRGTGQTEGLVKQQPPRTHGKGGRTQGRQRGTPKQGCSASEKRRVCLPSASLPHGDFLSLPRDATWTAPERHSVNSVHYLSVSPQTNILFSQL